MSQKFRAAPPLGKRSRVIRLSPDGEETEELNARCGKKHRAKRQAKLNSLCLIESLVPPTDLQIFNETEVIFQLGHFFYEIPAVNNEPGVPTMAHNVKVSWRFTLHGGCRYRRRGRTTGEERKGHCAKR